MTMQAGHSFRKLIPNKSRISASEYNRAMVLIEKLARSTLMNSFTGASGILTRRDPVPPSSATAIYARIVQTLQREDVELSHDKINWYEIELLSLKLQDWVPDHGTYYVGNLVKYQSKIYECKIEHNASASFPPTVVSHWGEASNIKAWVFGYSGDLIEAVPWFQVDDIVEVIRYDDSRWSDRKYWILKTVIQVEEGNNYSLTWNDEENRLMAVFG